MGRKSKVKEITYGIFGSLVDILIWQVALVGVSVGKYGSRGVYQAFTEADEFLNKVNHTTLAATWHQLLKKGLITYKKRNNLYSPQITEFGRKRLTKTLPHYQAKRPWDKRIYLITYDIPEIAHKKRDQFRLFLKNLGCKLLQESNWLTPYNPRELVNGFVQKFKIPGTVIVSDIGQDGGVGEKTIQDLLVKLYLLEKINDKYEEFLKDARGDEGSWRDLIFQYLSILKDDPQLPFALLPQWWLGDKAYHVYKRLKERYIISSRPRVK